MDNVVLFTGLFVVLAALIAAGAALIGSRLTSQANERTLVQAGEIERARWDREDARRHEQARREAYNAFLATADEAVLGLNRILMEENLNANFAGPHWPERMRDALNQIEFVGTPETHDLARRFDRAIRRFITGVAGLRNLI